MRRVDEMERLRRYYTHYDSTPALVQKRDTRNPGNQQMANERERLLRVLLSTSLPRMLSECRVLDIGCGRGGFLGWLHELGAPTAHLAGVDLATERLEDARHDHPGIDFREANAEALPFPDSSFDLVTCFTVFCTILDPTMARNVAREVVRVLRPQGKVLWYEMRYPNPWNRGVRGVSRRQLRDLFPGFELELRPITVIPPLARRLGRLTEVLYPLLAAIPPLRTHYMGLLWRNGAAHI